MFIERSVTRIRLVRTLFVLLGIVPCAGLVAWAATWHSGVYLRAVERGCEQVIGLPLTIGGVEHVRPNVMRLRDCTLRGESGAVVLRTSAIEVESLASELRVTLGRVDCTPELARTLRRLADGWLRQPARFPVDCVVDVQDFSWRQRRLPAADMASDEPAGRGRATPLHVECVAANGSRAVRVRRSRDHVNEADEVRVVSGSLAVADGGDAAAESVGRTGPRPDGGAVMPDTVGLLGVRGSMSEPVPIAVFEALAGLEEESLPMGGEAVVSGSLDVVITAGRLSGSVHGIVERIDLSEASRFLPHRISGEASLAVDEIRWKDGRITNCACRCSMSRGRVGQRLLEACVAMLGCRPGPAFRSLAPEEMRSFDDVAAVLRIDSSGVGLHAAPDRAGSLARVQGLSLIDEPSSPVSLDRIAWVLAAPGTVAVPASSVTGWLLGFSALAAPDGLGEQGKTTAGPPRPSPVNGQRGVELPERPRIPDGTRIQAVRPLHRSEF